MIAGEGFDVGSGKRIVVQGLCVIYSCVFDSRPKTMLRLSPAKIIHRIKRVIFHAINMAFKTSFPRINNSRALVRYTH